MSQEFLQYAKQYHLRMPERIRQYLNGRGISDSTIERYLLGWSGWRITIPIYDCTGDVSFFKLAKDPEDQMSESPKMLTTPGASAELYGWEHIQQVAEQVIVCEGEFDRLLLESIGYSAVTSTAGAATFRRSWAEALAAIARVYVCFDRDAAGCAGALRVARLIPRARIVNLPAAVGEGGDVTDFFVRLGRTLEDFEALLAEGQPLPADLQSPVRQTNRTQARGEVQELKASVRIEEIVARYVELTPKGRVLVARCPFHEDRTPSLVVYPDSQTFYCFGCRAHGDVVSFLMQAGGLTFRDALDALRKPAA